MKLFDQGLCRYLTEQEEAKLRALAPRAVVYFEKQPTPQQIKQMKENEQKIADKGINTDRSFLVEQRKIDKATRHYTI